MQKGLIPLDERKIEPLKEDLVAVPSLNPNKPIYLARPVANLAIDLVKEARAAGFKHPYFSIGSGYRTIKSQEKKWKDALIKYGSPEKADDYVARPGRSSHHTGFAFDIFLGYSFNSEDIEKIKKGRAYKYMRDHLGPKYNLTQLRSEPWHWECNEECRNKYVRYAMYRDGIMNARVSDLRSAGLILNSHFVLTFGAIAGLGFLAKHIRDKG